MRKEDLTDPRDKKHAEKDEARNRAATYSDSHQRKWDDTYYAAPKVCAGCNRKIMYWRTYCKSCEPR